MALRVTAAAPDRLLCTRLGVKVRLNLTSTATHDAKIDGFIRAASAAIESYLGRPLARQTYQEGVTGNDRRRLFLSVTPVDSNSATLTIDSTAYTDFTVEVPEIGQLWRESNWSSNATTRGQDGEQNVVVTYKGGYCLPNWLDYFVPSFTYTTSKWVRPNSWVKDLLMECTTAGAAGSSEPTWPTTAGSTVTSGSAVFTARHAWELPPDLEEAAVLSVASWFRGGLDAPMNVESESLGPMYVRYRDASSGGFVSALPMAVTAILDSYR